MKKFLKLCLLILFLIPSVSQAADPNAHQFGPQGWQVQSDCTGSTANGVGCWNGTTLCIGNGTSCAVVSGGSGCTTFSCLAGIPSTIAGYGLTGVVQPAGSYAPAFTSGTANYFWATPNGSAGVPSLRTIVAADIPALSYAPVSGSANYQATQALLTSLSGLSVLKGGLPYFASATTMGVIAHPGAANYLFYTNATDTEAWLQSSANMISLLGSADYATARTNLGLAIGTDVQGYNANMVISSGTRSANQFTCWDSTGTYEVSCGAPVVDGSTASTSTELHFLKKHTDGTVADALIVEKLAVFNWDGGGSALTAAATTKRCAFIPYGATLTGLYASSQAESTSNVTIALYKDAFAAGSHSTTAMISGTNAVVIPSAGTVLNVNDTTLTGFTTAISAGDQICATITATDTTTWLQLTLYGKRK
jgi:hypothetical protein